MHGVFFRKCLKRALRNTIGRNKNMADNISLTIVALQEEPFTLRSLAVLRKPSMAGSIIFYSCCQVGCSRGICLSCIQGICYV